MKISIFTALFSIIALCSCSLRTIPPEPSSESSGTAYLPRTFKILPISEKITPLRIRFNYEGDEKGFAVELQQQVIANANSSFVQIIGDDNADMTLNVSYELKDVYSGSNSYSYDGRIAIGLIPCNSSHLYASHILDLKSGRISSSAEEAGKTLLQGAKAQVAVWTREQLNALASDRINAANLRFALRNKFFSGNYKKTVKDIAVVENAIASTKGIISYKLVEQDLERGFCTFRVVYFKEEHIGGVIRKLLPALD